MTTNRTNWRAMQAAGAFQDKTKTADLKTQPYSCCAVSAAAKVNHGGQYRSNSPERIAYQELLLGTGQRLHLMDFDNAYMEFEGPKNHRVLALCMAATLAEEEGL